MNSGTIYAANAITENADGLVTGVHFYSGYDDGDGVGDALQDSFTYESGAVFVQWYTRNNNSRFEATRAGSIVNDSNDQYIVVTDRRRHHRHLRVVQDRRRGRVRLD